VQYVLTLGLGVDLPSLQDLAIDLRVIAESSLEILGMTPNGIKQLGVRRASICGNQKYKKD
jgi:hypothetical protein